MIAIVVAHNQDLVIGRDGDIPWRGKLPADMDHFVDLTEGSTVLMGRTTWKSIPVKFRPLSNRRNVILSRDAAFQPNLKNVVVYNQFKDVVKFEPFPGESNLFVMGGSQIYTLALDRVEPWVERMYVTEVQTERIVGDTYFPRVNPNRWAEIERLDYEPHGKNEFPYSFITYERKEP